MHSASCLTSMPFCFCAKQEQVIWSPLQDFTHFFSYLVSYGIVPFIHAFRFLLMPWFVFMTLSVLMYIFYFCFQMSRKLPLSETSNENLSAADQAWNKFQRCNESLIQSLFYGQQRSTVSCLKCCEESVTYEAFSDLSLPLPSSSNKCLLSVSFKLFHYINMPFQKL